MGKIKLVAYDRYERCRCCNRYLTTIRFNVSAMIAPELRKMSDGT